MVNLILTVLDHLSLCPCLSEVQYSVRVYQWSVASAPRPEESSQVWFLIHKKKRKEIILHSPRFGLKPVAIKFKDLQSVDKYLRVLANGLRLLIESVLVSVSSSWTVLSLWEHATWYFFSKEADGFQVRVTDVLPIFLTLMLSGGFGTVMKRKLK